MTTTTNKPAATLTDGLLRASIWRNEGKSGAFYSVTFSRLYQPLPGDFAASHSFSGAELLRLAKLAEGAYAEAAALREQAKISGADAAQGGAQ